MTRARKIKIFKTTLLLSGALVSTASLVSAVYFSRKKSEIEKYNTLSEKNVTPAITNKTNIIVVKDYDSLTDNPLEEIITTIKFVFEDQEIKREEIVLEEDETTKILDAENEIPKGFELDPKFHDANKEIILEYGKVNVIHIRPIKIVPITKIQFKANNENVGGELSFQVENLDEIKVNSYIPEGYKLIDNYEINLKIGETNIIPIEKIKVIVATKLTYKLINDSVIFTKDFKSVENTEFNATEYIPSGYEWDDSKGSQTLENLKAGKEYIFYIRKTIVTYNTKITYTYKNSELTSHTFTTQGSRSISKEEISQYIPNSYQLASTFDINSIRIGQENSIELVKSPVETKIIFKLNDKNGQTIYEKTFSTSPEEQITYKNLIPSGYVLSETAQQPTNEDNLQAGKTYTFFLREKIKTIFTTLVITANNKEVTRKVLISEEDEKITIEDISNSLPRGYKLDSNYQISTLKIGEVNTINVIKITIKHRTRLIYQTADGIVMTDATIPTVDDQEININLYMPTGYKLKSGEKPTIIVDDTTGKNIIKIERKEDDKPKPIVVEPDTPDPEPDPNPTRPVGKNLTAAEIRKIIYDGGSTVNASSRRYSKPSTLPTVEKAVISEAKKTEIRNQIKKLQEIAERVIKKPGTFTASDFEGIFPYKQPDVMEKFVKLMNGTPKREIGYADAYGTRDMTAEEIAIAFRDALKVAAASAEREMAEGRVIRWPSNIGEFVPTWGYDSKYNNPTLVSYIKANEKLAFPIADREYPRNGADQSKGKYPGWTDQDISSTYRIPGGKPSYGQTSNGRDFIDGGGIAVREYTPNSDNSLGQEKGKQKVAFMDASNPNAVNNIIQFLRSNRDISGLFIKNIGLKDENQDISNILKQIPSSIDKLTLIYDTEKMIGISALKNLRLKQAELLTTLPNTDDNIGDGNLSIYKFGWGIDPIAFKNTEFVPYDFQMTRGWDNYKSNIVYTGPIQFNVIRPDKGSTLDDIKTGFDMVLRTKKDWRVFNGQFGDQGYPIKIDLSLTKFNSLKGINLGEYYFRVLKLPSKRSTFTFNIADLGASQFSKILADWGPTAKPMIVFGDLQTSKIHLKGTAQDFSGKWNKELQGFLTGVLNNQQAREIIVDDNNVKQIITGSPGWKSEFKISIASDNNGGLNFE
ncbi:putative immunoglobulin-blocking virulence protein [Mycoplasmopsis gallinarum]|uniref:Immunoglobulin-blocking virulence protein n=1 Tax=Mycoplasmopsis gallinarum TaxID=29557 RepID=A0A168RKS3_9BACT|nr:putative immunoglobulin-blocking virulence protein [Mycoplasmopsis gallinarum]OAB49073.1 hypothetical protein MGALLINA_01080 [Mycoplasmopsis gallinarum]